MSEECSDHEAHERTRRARKVFVCFASFAFQTALTIFKSHNPNHDKHNLALSVDP